jgi:hypothetical protein
MEPIKTGVTGHGLAFATCGEWRVVAHADSGYHRERIGSDGRTFYLLPRGVRMPTDVERELCAILGIDLRPY